jgi:gas vesicle protein
MAAIIKPDDCISEKLKMVTPTLNNQLFTLVNAAVVLEKEKANASRVDGCIIGTGKADFTQDNTCYTLHFQGKPIQLIDVPGIEGDEGKYVEMVRKAIAKAHLVVYVNGTNKKPEKATAEKIRAYLRRGSQVYPIVNVRGNADAYEFEEDRVSLNKANNEDSPLTQTISVLESILGKKALLPGNCVHGLLAFSSLAINSGNNKTSIHPSRSKDLVIHQRKYFESFSTADAMFRFSQISELANAMQKKSSSFKEDIIESNKNKVKELLKENINLLESTFKDHNKFIEKVKPEFIKCQESINGAVESFERLLAAKRKNSLNDFFNTLIKKSDDIVAEHFGDQDLITVKIQAAFKLQQESVGELMQEQLKDCIIILQENMSQSMMRLFQDVHRMEFQHKISLNDNSQSFCYHSADLDMGLDFKNWAFNIGSYTVSGLKIGSAFPGIGNIIGAAVGAVIGLFLSLLDFFSSKETRIRKAQGKVQDKIYEVKNQVVDKFAIELKNITTSIRKEIMETTLIQVETIFNNLSHPLLIITSQIKTLSHLNEQLENMEYGTI